MNTANPFPMKPLLQRTLAAILMSVSLQAEAVPTAITQNGTVTGFIEKETEVFLGIPFAKPPIGELRWQPPQALETRQGTLQATAFGPACMQFGNFYTSNDPTTFEKPYGSEDCLYLNIWKPKTAEKRPVVVYIHGGSAVHGAASFPLYNGQRLAQEMDAVFVSINYRLAFFGNLQLKALRTGDPAADSGYFALLDQIRALEWVKENISAFGGDTANVTVMGQSAGCASIWSLMRSPLASGTFDKTICLSGIPLSSTPKKQKDTAHALLANLLINDDKIAKADELESFLKSLSDNELRDYLYSKTAVEISAAGQRIPMVPGVVDGHVITTSADEPVVNAVPTLMGQTLNEAPILMLHAYGKHRYTGLWNTIHCDCDFSPRDLFNSWYDYAKFKVVGWGLNKALLRLVNDGADLLEDQNGVPVYRYNLIWDNMPEPWRSMIGVYHGLDVAFAFGNFGVDTPNFTHFTWDNSTEEEREAIHTLMAQSFKRFIETGTPNESGIHPVWPRWGESRRMLEIQ